jgi:hypothetical protein
VASNSRTKTLLAVALFAAGVVPWFFTSDVARLVVYQRPVLLGRYGVGRFMALAFLVTPALWTAAWAVWRLRTRPPRYVVFRLIALGLALVFGVVLLDGAGRLLRKGHYVKREVVGLETWPLDQRRQEVIQRPPDTRYEVRVTDDPPQARSYPARPAGYPAATVTLTTDAWGYRNPGPPAQCDVVAVGDSFTEGLLVSDGQEWPARLGAKLGRTVYNLGMAGTDPEGYRNALASYGLRLRPKVAVLMIYQENDFYGVVPAGAAAPSTGLRLKHFVETSPVVLGLKHVLVNTLGGVNADGDVPGLAEVAWMPAAVPEGPGAKYYCLRPKRLLFLHPTEAAFRDSYGWKSTAEVLRETRALCEREAIHLLLVYAPAKSQVLLPLLGDRLSPQELHAFVALTRRTLPAPEDFARAVHAGIDTHERVLRRFCDDEGIAFLSTTRPLGQAMAEGRQVFFTYDEHWTPEGHELVADLLVEPLRAALSEAD